MSPIRLTIWLLFFLTERNFQSGRFWVVKGPSHQWSGSLKTADPSSTDSRPEGAIHVTVLMMPYISMDRNNLDDEKGETRLYIGNLDQRITESHLIKMFSPYGKIVSEDFLWHTRGPKRGEPRGFAFIQFSTKEEAQQAKEKMNGRLACGRPLVVRLATEKYLIEATNPPQAVGDAGKSTVASGPSGQMNRSAKIAAIKNKLKAMEEESCSSKKPRSI